MFGGQSHPMYVNGIYVGPQNPYQGMLPPQQGAPQGAPAPAPFAQLSQFDKLNQLGGNKWNAFQTANPDMNAGNFNRADWRTFRAGNAFRNTGAPPVAPLPVPVTSAGGQPIPPGPIPVGGPPPTLIPPGPMPINQVPPKGGVPPAPGRIPPGPMPVNQVPPKRSGWGVGR
jgi:hypothetical protein